MGIPEKNGKEEKDAYKIYEELIKDNIEYEHLISTKRLDRDRIDAILDLKGDIGDAVLMN